MIRSLTVAALILVAATACSSDDPAGSDSPGGEATTTRGGVITTAPAPDQDETDAALAAILAAELEGGIIDPLPVDSDIGGCAAERIVAEMGAAEGETLDDYLASNDAATGDDMVDLVLTAYFGCADADEVGNHLAEDLIETIGLPSDPHISECLSDRLDSVDEVGRLVAADSVAVDPVSILGGCVGLGDVMSVEIDGLSDDQHSCLNEEGADVLSGMLQSRRDEATELALRNVLEGCGLDPGSVAN